MDGCAGRLHAVKALGAGLLLGTVNPKNLLLVVGGAAAVAQTGISTGDQIVAWAVFTLIASLGVGAPVVIFFALGDRAAKLLDELKTWLARNNTAIMAVLCLIIAVKLIGDAITGFSSYRAEESHRTPPAAAPPRSLTRSR